MWSISSLMIALMALLQCIKGSAFGMRTRGLGLSHTGVTRSFQSAVNLKISESTSETDGNGSLVAIGASGIVFNGICDYSLYVLKTTSCGLPPGPFGLLGAAEGISYLGVVGLVFWSAYTKVWYHTYKQVVTRIC